jgi:hypothetical protein
MEGAETLQKLKKKLTIANVRTALNAGNFKEFVDDIREFKKKQKIQGNLRDIVNFRTGDLPSLAKKFDIIIPPSGVLDPAEIDRTLSALKSIKKLNKGLKADINFPRYVDLYPSKEAEIPEREIPEAQKEIMKGVERTKVKLVDKVQEKGEPKMTDQQIKKISKTIVDTALAKAVEGIEKKEKMKLNKEQKEVIREQIEKETEDKIKKSSDLTKTKVEAEKILEDMEKIGNIKIPEEMTTSKEEIEEGKKAQARAKEMRSKPKEMTEEEVDEILGTSTEQEQQETPQQRSNENVKMDMKKPDTKTEIDDLQPLPSKTDFIPPMRLGTRGKDIKELLEDIAYFMKNFKGQLKREAEIFKEVDKTNIEQLRKLHSKIVGKLAPNQKKEEGKKVGIIVNADEYIREQMKKILQEQTFSSLRPQDVVIDVGSKAAEGRDNKDFGDFEVKRTIDGGLASKREAIYRYMPSENNDEVGEQGKTEEQRRKPNRLSMPKARLNNKRTTAIRMNIQNPFRVPQKTIKLKYLY